MHDRKSAEQRFYDRAYESGTLDTKNGFYEISAGVLRYRSRLFADCKGKRILEYGCGLGGQAFALAEAGATVTGIDISDIAVAHARKQAEESGIRNVRFMKGDAEALEFPAESLDVVCGSGILHHLDLPRALAEVKRVLAPGGRAIFYEPLGHNPLLNLYRWLTPGSHTRDEHPLLRRDIALIRDTFAGVTLGFFDFFTIFVIPILRIPGATALLRAAEAADRLLFRLLPPARWWGGVIVVELEKRG